MTGATGGGTTRGRWIDPGTDGAEDDRPRERVSKSVSSPREFSVSNPSEVSRPLSTPSPSPEGGPSLRLLDRGFDRRPRRRRSARAPAGRPAPLQLERDPSVLNPPLPPLPLPALRLALLRLREVVVEVLPAKRARVEDVGGEHRPALVHAEVSRRAGEEVGVAEPAAPAKLVVDLDAAALELEPTLNLGLQRVPARGDERARAARPRGIDTREVRRGGLRATRVRGGGRARGAAGSSPMAPASAAAPGRAPSRPGPGRGRFAPTRGSARTRRRSSPRARPRRRGEGPAAGATRRRSRPGAARDRDGGGAPYAAAIMASRPPRPTRGPARGRRRGRGSRSRGPRGSGRDPVAPGPALARGGGRTRGGIRARRPDDVGGRGGGPVTLVLVRSRAVPAQEGQAPRVLPRHRPRGRALGPRPTRRAGPAPRAEESEGPARATSAAGEWKSRRDAKRTTRTRPPAPSFSLHRGESMLEAARRENARGAAARSVSAKIDSREIDPLPSFVFSLLYE